MKPYGIIYKATNTINGKVYIGQTKKKLSIRKMSHHNTKEKSFFQKEIDKDGKENFIFETIYECHNQKELNEKEEFFIERYKSYLEDFGYNKVRKCNVKEFKGVRGLHIGLRIPADILAKLCQSAKANTRSLSAEILHRIKITFGSKP